MDIVDHRIAATLARFGISADGVSRETTLTELDLDSLSRLEFLEMLKIHHANLPAAVTVGEVECYLRNRDDEHR